jgi:formylglycine-generating enzyme required for sulfatase activity
VPASLEELVDACLATNPEERIQNAGAIARALTGPSPVSAAHTTSTRLPLSRRGAKKSNAGMMGLAAGIILAAAIAAYVVATRASSNQERPSEARPAVDSGMVLIPAGTYTIGSDDGPAIVRPAHQVPLDAFSLEAMEVTVADFNSYLRARGLPPPWTTMPDSALPVTGVLYAEAMNYCAWRHPDGGRLPREEEWEAAARGPAGRSYPWGSAWNASAANTQTANRGGPAPVGSYLAGRTPEGVSDLIGNVWEWTASPYRSYGDTATGAPQYYVIRGGGYNALDRVSTAIFRGAMPAVTERGNLAATGFRCAMPARN